MSITKEAVAMINRLGSGTVDDVHQQMPKYTRAQLFRALRYGLESRLIESDGWQAPNGSKGSPPTTYRALRKTVARPVASVWQLAEAA